MDRHFPFIIRIIFLFKQRGFVSLYRVKAWNRRFKKIRRTYRCNITVLNEITMKKPLIAVLSLTSIFVGCEKDVAHVSVANTTQQDKVVAPVTVITFNQVPSLRTITTREHDIIFSDSIYVSDDEAIFKTLKFNIQGRHLFLSNYAFFINGVRYPVTGTFQDSVLTVFFDKTTSLSINKSYKVELRAKVSAPQQTFTVSLQPGDVNIVNYYYESPAILYGLPVSYSVRALKS
jgi:hypothetical protein